MVRIVILATIFAGFFSVLKAQNGDLFVGGSLGIKFNKIEEPDNGPFNVSLDEGKIVQWNFSPEVGIWVTDNSQLGLALTLYGIIQNEVNNTLGIAPNLYLRKWVEISENFSAFGSLGVSYSYVNNGIYDSFTDEIISNQYINSVGANLIGGIGYSLTDSIDILGKLGILSYGYAWVENNNGQENYTTQSIVFDLNSGAPVFDLGIYYTFRKKE